MAYSFVNRPAVKDDVFEAVTHYQKIKDQTLLPKNSSVLELDKVGHMAFVEAEKEVNEAMKKFVEYCVNLKSNLAI